MIPILQLIMIINILLIQIIQFHNKQPIKVKLLTLQVIHAQMQLKV